MNVKLTYTFSSAVFNIANDVFIEFKNPPYIPNSKVLMDIDFHSFFDDEIADEICRKLEDDRLLLPYKTMEVWNDTGVYVLYEFMNTEKILEKKIIK